MTAERAVAPAGEVVASAEELPAPSWRATAAVAAWQAVVAAVLLRGSYYYVDDFTRFVDAQRSPFGWGYLSTPIFGHFVPGYRLVAWVIQHTAPLQFWPAAIWIVACQVLIAVLLHRLLGDLFGNRMAVHIAVAGYAINPILVATVLWWANALHVLSALAAALAATRWFVAWWLRRRPVALIGSVAALAFGLLFYEKPLMLLGILPVLVLLVSLQVMPLRRAVAAVVRLWPAWLAYGAVAAVYVGYVQHRRYGLAQAPPGLGRLVTFVGYAWIRAFSAGLLGGPLRWTFVWPGGLAFATPPLWLSVLAAVVVALAVVVTVMRRGRRAATGWLFLAAAWVASAGLMGYGRLGDGFVIARDYPYFADVLWLVVLGVLLAALPLRPAAEAAIAPMASGQAAPGRHRAFRHSPRRRAGAWPVRTATALSAVAVIAYAATSAVSVVRYRRNWVSVVPSGYWARVRQQVPALEGRGVALLDTDVPPVMELPGTYPTTRLSFHLDLIGLHPLYDDATRPLVVVTGEGNVESAQLQVDQRAIGERPVCVEPGRSADLALSHPMPPDAHDAILSSTGAGGSTVRLQLVVAGGGLVGATEPESQLKLAPGANHRFVNMRPTSAVAVRVTVESGAATCVTQLDLGRVVPTGPLAPPAP